MATDKKKEEVMRTMVLQKLEETGEGERLRELLRQKLIDSGWHDDLRNYAKDLIRRDPLEEVTVDGLVTQITPEGRATVPAQVKAELLAEINAFIKMHT